MFNPMSRPLRRSPQARRRLACRLELESLEVREVLSLATGAVIPLVFPHIQPLADISTRGTPIAPPIAGPTIQQTDVGRLVVFSGTAAAGTEVLLIPVGGLIQTQTSSTLPPGVPPNQITASPGGYTWTTSTPLGETTADGSGHWSLSVDLTKLPSVATKLTFQFTQPSSGTTVSRSFAYDPGAGGATSQGPTAPGPSGAGSIPGAVLRQAQFGADVIFSGTAAPGASITLLPSYTVTSVPKSGTSAPASGIPYWTSINPDGTTTYSWYVCTATSTLSPPADVTATYTEATDPKTGAITYSWPTDYPDSTLGSARADSAGDWSMIVPANSLPNLATSLTFVFNQAGATSSQTFAYTPLTYPGSAGQGTTTVSSPAGGASSGTASSSSLISMTPLKTGGGLFSGTAAPGTSVILIPDCNYTVTSVFTSSQYVPSGILYGTYINPDGTTTYSWYVCTATSSTLPADRTLTVTARNDPKTGAITYTWPLNFPSNSIGVATADSSGVWSMLVQRNGLPAVATTLNFEFVNIGSPYTETFHYNPGVLSLTSPQGFTAPPIVLPGFEYVNGKLVPISHRI